MGFQDIGTGVPFLGTAFDSSFQDSQDLQKKISDLYGNAQPPDIYHQQYSPEQYQSAGNYDPSLSSYQLAQDNPQLQSQQTSYLNQLAGLANNGLGPQDQAEFTKAQQQSNQQARGQMGALQNRAQAQGTANGGLNFVLQQQAGQDAAQRSQDANLSQAASSANTRALYNAAYGNALSGTRQQDFNNQMANANIINQFNRYNTGTQNQGQLYNLQNQQGIMNRNVGENNQAQLYNQGNNYGDQSANWNRAEGYRGDYSKALQNQASADTAQGTRNQKGRDDNLDNVKNLAMLAAL